MSTTDALIKREILEGKNGFILVPMILAAIAIVLVMLTLMGFGKMEFFHGAEAHGILSFSDAITKMQEARPDDWPAGIMVGYWVMTMPVWIVLPFVVFFSLLGTLYEERRDRSILFWKSMPVPDWQEVLVKLAVPVFVAPIMYLIVAIAAQFVIALLLSFVLLFQGGDISALWPIGLMIEVWSSGVGGGLVYGLWLLPIAGWVLFVSSFAGRMPFMWAVLPPLLLMIIEAMFFDSHEVLRWISVHLGGWMDLIGPGDLDHVDGPRDILRLLMGGPFVSKLGATFMNLNFWTGLVVGAGFIYGAITMRKKAL